jgi:hypothetical protein
MSDPTRVAAENEEVVTRLALDLEAKGQTNCPWQVKAVEISDATGNRWRSDMWGSKTKARQQGVTQTMNLPGNLWPGESAWKLRVELAPTSEVPPDELATLAGIALPPEGSALPLSLSNNIGGFTFRLEKIDTKKSSANARGLSVPVSISYVIDGMPDDCRLFLVEVTDEQRRKVQINGSGELSRWGHSFELTVPPDSVRLNCTFGVQKSRFVQFLAKPRTLSTKPGTP